MTYNINSHERTTPRRRYLYALMFEKSNRCYIGQSVSPKRRNAQHKKTWGRERFTMYVLGSIYGTYNDAEEYEYAWRYRAHLKNIDVYGMPGVIINPTNRMSRERTDLSNRLKWPKKARRGGGRRRFVTSLIVGFILMSALYVGWKITVEPVLTTLQSH